MAANAHRVFERVREVADRRGNRASRLVVVDSPGDPWATALPDGAVVLSRRAIDIFYQEATRDEGDARAAFVLGHELAHLAKDDFWHRDVAMALAGDANAETTRRLLNAGETVEAGLWESKARIRLKETEADDLGFLYAGLAGFPVQTILGDGSANRRDFFSHWVAQTHTRVESDETHPTPEERSRMARIRLQRVEETLPYHRMGVRLAHFGRCGEAVHLFAAVRKSFPSREVFNNLGACHLQEALRELGGAAARFSLPVMFDSVSRAEPLRPPRPPTATRNDEAEETPPALSAKARELLEASVEELTKAAEDSRFLPARLNLATAQVQLGETTKARVALDEARRLAPDAPEVVGWQALILHLDSRRNGLGDVALPALITLAEKAEAPASLRFNLARILQLRGRTEAAGRWWKSLIPDLPVLSPSLAGEVCVQVACPPLTTGTAPFPWSLPIHPGDNLAQPNVRKRLGDWQGSPFSLQFGEMAGIIHLRGEEMELLEMNDLAELVALRGETLGTAETLKRRLGPARSVVKTAGGEIWTYDRDWAALIREGRVAETWIARKREE